MSKYLYLIVIFLLLSPVTDVISQEMGTQMTHKNGKRVRLLEEGKRIEVITAAGEKFKGKFTLVNDGSIRIEN